MAMPSGSSLATIASGPCLVSGGGGGGEAVQLKRTVGIFHSRLFMKVLNLDEESPLGQKDLTKVKIQAANTVNAHVKCTSKLVAVVTVV